MGMALIFIIVSSSVWAVVPTASVMFGLGDRILIIAAVPFGGGSISPSSFFAVPSNWTREDL